MDNDNRIKKIKKNAFKIDNTLNLFDGYFPKNIVEKKDENLFWYNIVNIYGLFCDSDRFQVKEKKNLFRLMSERELITEFERKRVVRFYRCICDLRGWFCHNNNPKLYFAEQRAEKVEQFIKSVFTLSSNNLRRFSQLSAKEWGVMNFSIEAHFEEYLDILEKGLLNWEKSTIKKDIIEEWYDIYSESLFSDQELQNNILAEMYQYQVIDQGLDKRTNTVSRGVKLFRGMLGEIPYTVTQIRNILVSDIQVINSSEEIIRESFKRIDLKI